MRNVTLSIEDELYEQARVIAAQRKTTITNLVRKYLKGLTEGEKRREGARREILRMIGTFDCRIGRLPTREERNARR